MLVGGARDGNGGRGGRRGCGGPWVEQVKKVVDENRELTGCVGEQMQADKR